MKMLLPRRLTTAGLLSLLCLTPQVTPVLCASLSAHARGSQAAAQTEAALAESLPESDLLRIVDYRRVFDEVVPRILADQREVREQAFKDVGDVAAVTGFDLRAVGRVVTGVRLAEVAGGKVQEGYTQVSLVRGVAQERWLAAMRGKGPGKVKESRHGSSTLYVLSLTAEEKRAVEKLTLLTLGDEGLAFAALDVDTLAYGTPPSVRAAVDARDGRGKKISTELAAAATRNRDAFFAMAGLSTPGLTADLLPPGKVPENEFVKMLANVKVFSTAVELAPAGVAVTVACVAGSAEQAKALGDIVNALKTLMVFSQPKSSRDKAGAELLKSVAVSVEGTEVRVRSVLPDATAKMVAMWGESESYVASGVEHEKKDELDAALADYNKALGIDPENVRGYVNRGRVYSARGEVAAAEADYSKAIDLAPDKPNAYNSRGFLRIRKREYEAAYADLDKAIALDPNFAYAYNNRGRVLAEVGRQEEALADYEKSIELDPKNAHAYTNRGLALSDLGEPAKAVADFDKALSLDPKFVEAYNGRGYARTALGELDAALADHEKALSLDPKSAGAYAGRGYARMHMEEYDAAVADMDKALTLSQTPPFYYHSNRGYARAGKGDYTGALADFDKALEMNPDAATGYHGRGYVRFSQGDYARAVADFDKAVALNPEYAEAYGYRGLALLALKKDAAAARDLKKCFELDASLRDFFEEQMQEALRTRRVKSRKPN
ncbi:MAG TPA: tetratricopeptide repeat protein [Pyrinomonadaceae bacterium]